MRCAGDKIFDLPLICVSNPCSLIIQRLERPNHAFESVSTDEDVSGARNVSEHDQVDGDLAA